VGIKSLHLKLVGALAVAAALAACSSSGGSSSNSSGPENAAQALAHDGKLRTCMAVDPPFSFQEGSEYKSFIPELLKKFAASAGVKIQYVPSNYTTIVASLQAKKCDFIGADLHETPERAAVVDFTQSIIPEGSGDVIFVRGDDPRYSTIDDLNNAKTTIAFLTGSASEEDKKVLPKAKFKGLQNVPTATLVAELTSMKVDAFATSSYLAPSLVQKYGFKTMPDIKAKPAGILPVPLGWAVTKGNTAFIKQLNAFLTAEAANGDIDQLTKTWLTLENSLK
jgi:ABC-type amino acid transport substrate-binding protein